MSEYVPMLIVGLNENEEYIHIRNAKNDESYICPCCGAKIKARAMKSDKVQPHFYLKIKNQPWQYNNSINGLKICFEKSHYEDSIKLIHKLPDEYDAYVKTYWLIRCVS